MGLNEDGRELDHKEQSLLRLELGQGQWGSSDHCALDCRGWASLRDH